MSEIHFVGKSYRDWLLNIVSYCTLFFIYVVV